MIELINDNGNIMRERVFFTFLISQYKIFFFQLGSVCYNISRFIAYYVITTTSIWAFSFHQMLLNLLEYCHFDSFLLQAQS